MALDFPASPTTGQTFSSGGQTWTYNGSGWASTYQASGTVRQAFTATSGQTSFTVTGGYLANLVDVYQNGVKLVNGTDVTVSSGTVVVLATGATLNDIIEVIGISSWSAANYLPIAGGTMTGAITFAGAQTIAGTLLTNTSVAVGKLSATGTPGATNFLRGDNTWAVASSSPTVLTYNSSSIWTKATDVPAGCTMAMIEVWGGGGGGSRNVTGTASRNGGGGGAYNYRVIPISSLGATETVTVGAGGLGATTSGAGGFGGNSSFTVTSGTPSSVIAYGGSGGNYNTVNAAYFLTSGSASCGGGTAISGQYAGYAISFDGTSYYYYPLQQTYNGGHGASDAVAASSMFGGGGGGQTNFTAGGTSMYGGNGGTAAATAGAGTQPGGGGASSTASGTNGGNGGAGRVKVTMW